MNLEIITRGAEINVPLRRYVDRKLERLEKLFDGVESVRIVFAKERFSHRCEVTVVGRHGTTKVRETTEDFRSAFDLVLDKLETRGRKVKAMVKEEHRRERPARRSTQAWKVNVIAPESLGGDDHGPRVVKRTRLPIRPMSIEEAADSLERSKNEFMVFRDSASDRISVLYRRHDDTLGLIEPEL